MVSIGERIWITWSISHGTIHDDTRANSYSAWFDPDDNHLYSDAGADLGTVITWAEMEASCKVYSADHFAGDGVGGGTHSVNNQQPFVDNAGRRFIVIPHWNTTRGLAELLVARWTGSAWVMSDTGITSVGLASFAGVLVRTSGDSLAALSINYTDGLRQSVSQDNGVSWESPVVLVPKTDVPGVSIGNLTAPQPMAPGLKALWAAGLLEWYSANARIYAITDEDASVNRGFVPKQSLTLPITTPIAALNVSVGAATIIANTDPATPGKIRKAQYETIDLSTLIDENVSAIQLEILVGAIAATPDAVSVRLRETYTGRTADARVLGFTNATAASQWEFSPVLVPVSGDRKIDVWIRNTTSWNYLVMSIVGVVLH
jgi:hypothetical protein